VTSGRCFSRLCWTNERGRTWLGTFIIFRLMASTSRGIGSSSDLGGGSEKRTVHRDEPEELQLHRHRSTGTSRNLSSNASFASSEAPGFANPLSGLSREELFDQVERFAHEKGLSEHVDVLRRGALVAQKPWSECSLCFLMACC
jgi:hypothetical protein